MYLDNPSIDVVIPTYNSMRYLPECIQSVLDQTLQPKNIFICDDGSTDETPSFVKSLHHSATHIHYLPQKNSGVSVARNNGIAHSKAEYIAFLDADDIWERNKLEKQVSVFYSTKLPNIGVVYCDYYTFDNDQKKKKEGFSLDPKIRGDVSKYLCVVNTITGSASGVLIKRSCFTDVGFFDNNLYCYEDQEMWLRLSTHYQFDYFQEDLVGIRRHEKSTSKSLVVMSSEYIKFSWKWKEYFYLSRDVLPKRHKLHLYYFSLLLRNREIVYFSFYSFSLYIRLCMYSPVDVLKGMMLLISERFRLRH